MTHNLDLALLHDAVTWLDRQGKAPPLAVVLGSGLGAFADRLGDRRAFPYSEIPHAPRSTVTGHAGQLVLGQSRNTPVAVLSGRVHLYEGQPHERVVFLVRALSRWGVQRFLLTNAAGGINLEFRAGDLMVVSDHLNLMGSNPLFGSNDDEVGPRFLDLTTAYDAGFRSILKHSAKTVGFTLREGVYAGLLGPNYETPAEVRMLRGLGADAVGMSTVPEVLALRHLGAKIAALSCITNLAAGVTGEPLSHAEVKATADATADRFIELLETAVPALAAG